MFGPVVGIAVSPVEFWLCSTAGTVATIAPVFSYVSKNSRLVQFEDGTKSSE
jgi:hypothetical protein